MRRCFSVAAEGGSSIHLWHLLLRHEGLGFSFCVTSHKEKSRLGKLCESELVVSHFSLVFITASNISTALTDTLFKENCFLNCPFMGCSNGGEYFTEIMMGISHTCPEFCATSVLWRANVSRPHCRHSLALLSLDNEAPSADC